MRSFVNARLNRDEAIAKAGTTTGAAAMRRCFMEQTEAEIQVPQEIGGLLDALMLLKGDAVLPRLLAAIPEGSDLIAVTPAFIHWVLTTQTRDAPSDFVGLNDLRAAAILAMQRRLGGMRGLLSPAQAEALQPVLLTHGAQAGVSPRAIEAHRATWRQVAQAIKETEPYPPAKWLATTYAMALDYSPGAVALAVSGKFGGDRPAGIDNCLLDKTLALLAQASVTEERPGWLR